MARATSISLYHVHDPMCSWCYGFAPVWRELEQRLPDELQVVRLVGGLARDCDEPMAEGMRNMLQDTWRRIMQAIPGTRFNFDFWSNNTPRRSTYPACRAVLAARRMGGKDEAMTAAIQQAYYQQARNPSDADTLIDLAVDIGLQREAFASLLGSDEIQQALLDELDLVRSIDVHSFPSLVLVHNDDLQAVKIDYNSAHNMLFDINRFITSISR